MFIQYVHNLCQMKEPLLGINIRFCLEEIDKLLKLQRHVLW